jgi:uncharacterized membrane protein
MKKYFLTGLATLLPVAVTLWLVSFVINFLTKPFVGIVSKIISRTSISGVWASEGMFRGISQVSILIFFFLLLIFIGMVARWFLFTSLLKIGDYVLGKTPLINKVYNTAKEIINILFASNKNSFKQVVMVRFPNRNCYSLGLITREAPTTCSDAVQKELLSIFIPTTPNPMTGYLITSAKSDVYFLDMKPEDAVKYVVSCGVIQPKRKGDESH